MKTRISVIIRTKNEERWIGRCISAIKQQQSPYAVEIVVVDSGSTDKTVDKARSFNATKIIKISRYLPGYSINEGVRNSSGSIIVVLSAHCIPASDTWLESLVQPIVRGYVRATYGRQLPTPGSSARDSRDLIITFGVEDKLQKVDTFYHNANSAFCRTLWRETNFDEKVTNIEDRLWAEQVISNGNNILYVSNAGVFHWHGIHQDGNKEREISTGKILREYSNVGNSIPEYRPNSHNSTCIIPVKDYSINSFQELSLRNAIHSLESSKYKWTVLLLTHKEIKLSSSARVQYYWLDRSKIYNNNNAEENLCDIAKYALNFREKNLGIAENVCILNYEYIFRDVFDIDDALTSFLYYDSDICWAAYAENLSPVDEQPCTDALQIECTSVANLLSQSKRVDSAGRIILPGYLTVLHASILRNENPKRISTYKHLIKGQEKLLKFNSKEQLLAFELKMHEFDSSTL
jgi:rhamnosyltransferase